jgi:signal transduction protein with GAF and PtsI domain
VPEKRVASITSFARALGGPLETSRGQSLALTVEQPGAPRALMEGIVRTAAAMFEASASSIALTDEVTGELVYQAAWGAGAREIVGVRLPPGQGISGHVVATGDAEAVADCASDARFAARIAEGTGYVPYTMLVVPLSRGGRAIGVLSLLDRRGGNRYGAEHVERASLFAELAVSALDVDPGFFHSLGTSLGHRPA